MWILWFNWLHLIITESGYGDSKKFGAQSDCQYHYLFSMKVSDKIPKSYPCSNRPVKCEYCDEIYWSYNMEAHHLAKHKGMNFNSLITESEERLVRKIFSN